MRQADDQPANTGSVGTSEKAGGRSWPTSGVRSIPPGLHIVATPIGRLRDITLHALDVLAGADAIFAEDTRVTRRLLDHFGVTTRIDSYHEHNAQVARDAILIRLRRGECVALVSDAGTPLISDPGYKLVRAVRAEGLPVHTAPGPSAVTAALSVAGLPTDAFLFAGFAPAKSTARRRFFQRFAEVPASLVFFESGQRLAESLADMFAVFGAREAAVARELTKRFEEVRTGPLGGLAAHYAEQPAPPKGEIVVLTGPPLQAEPWSQDAVDAALKEALARLGVKAAAAEVAGAAGLPKREVYQRALLLKDASGE